MVPRSGSQFVAGWIYFGIFLAALVLSFCLTWFVRRWAHARGWVSLPAGRDVHRVPVPRIGGLAIYLAFVAICAGLAVLDFFGVKTAFDRTTIIFLLLPGTLVFAVGLYDDFRSASPWLKLGIQVLAALLLFDAGFRVFRLPLLFGVHPLSQAASFALTAAWVVLITNAFNLIDGLDGLAAGSSLFSTLTIFVLCVINNNKEFALPTLILAGATFGFLRFNFSPASIFLGDSGSLFLGFMLSALSLGGALKGPTIVTVAVPVVSFGLPLVETALSVLRRFIRGTPVFGADREHIHHKLLEKGFTQRQVVALMYGISAVCGLLSLFLVYPGGSAVGLILAVSAVGAWLGLQRLGYQELSEIQRVAQRTMDQKAVMRNNVAIRRATGQFAAVHDAATLRQVLRDCFQANDFDAFRLTLHPERILDAPGAAQGAKLNAGDLEFYWARDSVAPLPVWTLMLELQVEGRASIARFALYRHEHSRPLLVDVNVLSSDFQAALGLAVARVLERQRAAGRKAVTVPTAARAEV